MRNVVSVQVYHCKNFVQRLLRFCALIFGLFLLASCDSLPSNWNENLGPNNNINYNTTSVYVYGPNPSWTNSGVTYNPIYVSTISIFEDTPGYSGFITIGGQMYGYIGTASGTVLLCSQGNSLQSNFSQWLTDPGSVSISPFSPSSCQYINGILVSPIIDAESDSGKIEYIVSQTQPSDDDFGTVTNSLVTYNGISVLGATLENPQSGTIWLRVIDRGAGNAYAESNYYDNSGRYKVNIVQPTAAGSSTFLSSLAKFVITPVTQNINQVSQQIFGNAESSQEYISIIRILLLLYIAFYGFAFLTGMGGVTQKDFFIRMVKFGVVLTLTSGGAITFFNTYLFSFFVNGQTQLINLVTGSAAATVETGQLNYQTLFSFADYAINTVFSSHFFSVLGSFVLWFPIGWICLLMLGYAIVVYILAILEITIAYLMAYTGMGLLIALAPLFIPLILFQQTRQIFDGWIKAFAAYMMEPVVMFATITLIAAFINDTLFNIISLQLSSTAVLPIFIDFGSLGTLDLFTIYWPNPSGVSGGGPIPGGNIVIFVLTQVIIFYIFIALLKKSGELSAAITKKLFESGGSQAAASGMLGGIKTGVNAAVGAPVLAAGAAASAFAKWQGKKKRTSEIGKEEIDEEDSKSDNNRNGIDNGKNAPEQHEIDEQGRGNDDGRDQPRN